MSGINININLNLEKNKAAKSKEEKIYNGEPKKKKKKKQNKQKQTSPSPIPWGLNQERLKNYIYAQVAKRDNLLYQEQLRKVKFEEPKQDRRDILGVSFLNHLPKRKVKQMINKQKINEDEELMQYQPKFNEQKLQEIRMYKEWKQRQVQFELQFKKQQELERQTKIQQNLQNLNQYIKYRNHTTSVHQKKSVSIHKKKRPKSSMDEKKRELIIKYQNLANRYAQINEDTRDNQSCYGLVLDSDQEGISQMDSIHKSTRRQNVIISEPSLNEEEEQQIQELGNLEKEMVQIVKAAIIIQKVWRGYKTRHILQYYNNYLDEDEMKLNQLTPNLSQTQSQQEPISQSVQLGKEQSGLKSSQKRIEKNGFNTFFDQLDWDDKKGSHFSSQKVSSINKLSQQKSLHKIIIEKQKQQWNLMLEQISQLQRKGSKQNIKEVLQDLKTFTLQISKEIDGEINIDNEEKEQQQKSFRMSQIRQVMGSENLIKLSQNLSPANKDASLFEQNPFYDFASKKFRELLNPENMNKLIKMREIAIEERHKNEMININEAFQQKQISLKTFEKQKFKIEKWVIKEKEDFKQQKSNIEIGWKGLYESFIRTQKDLLFMSKLKNQQLTSSFSSENISNIRLIREINSGSQSKIVKTNNFDTVTMNFSSSICESQDIRKVPKSTPSPSLHQQQKQDNQQQVYEQLEWDDEMLYTSDVLDCAKIQQSQVIKISTLIQKEPEYDDSQIQSYCILIANSIIGNEIQDMYEELKVFNKDITTSIKLPEFKGIKSNIQQVKIYLTRLQQFLLQSDKNSALIQKINTPLGPTPKDILKFFHYYDEEDDYQSSEQDYSNQAILSTEQYAQLENLLMEEEQMSLDDGFLLELEHIHNKVLYDALNEALDYYRPFGLNGFPLPWVKKPLELIQRNKKQETLQQILQGAIGQVTDWASFLVGLIIDKPDSPFPKILMLDQEYLNQIKEERMIRMLNQEIYQNEERWLIYDEEQSEILVEISLMVQQQLIDECCKELLQFQ